MSKSASQYDIAGRQKFCEAILRRAKWLVRPYSSGDEAQILALCQRTFGFALTPGQWRWRNIDNPVGKSLIYVAEEKASGRIIGHLAATATNLKVGNFSRKGFFLVDSAVDPSYRGRGIHGVLTLETSHRGSQEGGFVFGLPNEQAYLPTLRMGGQRVLTMGVFFKGINWRRILETRLSSRLLARLIEPPIRLFQKLKQPRIRHQFDVQEVHRFGEQADCLWERIAPELMVLAIRNSTLLNWRYFDYPNSPYRIISISQNGRWQGYIAIRMLEKWGLRLGTIVDLLFDPGQVDAGRILIHQAEIELRNHGADAVWALFPAGWQDGRAFHQEGFLKTLLKYAKRQFHLLVDFVPTDLRPDLAQRDNALLKQGKHWFLSLGDTDLA